MAGLTQTLGEAATVHRPSPADMPGAVRPQAPELAAVVGLPRPRQQLAGRDLRAILQEVMAERNALARRVAELEERERAHAGDAPAVPGAAEAGRLVVRVGEQTLIVRAELLGDEPNRRGGRRP